MNCTRTVLALICLMSTAVTALAQDSANPTAEKWRPKEGLYEDPNSPDNRCGDFGELIIELRKNEISGNEWSCKVTKLEDTAPGAIRLAMTCDDYNLAEFIKDPNPERQFKETMLLRKIDGHSMFVRKTLNGKFKGPEWRAAYCPDDAQRMYVEAMARNKAEAEQKSTEERLRSNPWRPRDGVYAVPEKDFNERCLKSGDAIIDFSERSITSGPDKCSVTFIRDEPNALRVFVTCSNAQGSAARTADGGSAPARPRPETIILKGNVDNTVLLQKTANGEFIDSGKQLSYCDQDAQQRYA